MSTVKKSKTQEYIKTIVFMVAITFLFIAPLSFAYLKTKDMVKQNELMFLKKAVLYSANIKYPDGAKVSDIDPIYNKYVAEIRNPEGKILYYQIKDPDSGGSIKGYAYVTSGPGLWGEITGVVGVAPDKKTVTGVEFIKQGETPGLGARIEEVWFKEQFRGKTGPFNKTVAEKDPAGADQFQAITGATITSDGVKKLLNKTFTDLPKITQDGK
ncbi:MAG: FMN-binding protein [Firmicutes bacterium]|nr:FMN-binding protein [Bacillota bacterium]